MDNYRMAMVALTVGLAAVGSYLEVKGKDAGGVWFGVFIAFMCAI